MDYSDPSFVGKLAAHHIIILAIPGIIIAIICAVLIGFVHVIFRKFPILMRLLDFAVVALGALVFVALLPWLTEIALDR